MPGAVSGAVSAAWAYRCVCWVLGVVSVFVVFYFCVCCVIRQFISGLVQTSCSIAVDLAVWMPRSSQTLAVAVDRVIFFFHFRVGVFWNVCVWKVNNNHNNVFAFYFFVFTGVSVRDVHSYCKGVYKIVKDGFNDRYNRVADTDNNT